MKLNLINKQLYHNQLLKRNAKTCQSAYIKSFETSVRNCIWERDVEKIQKFQDKIQTCNHSLLGSKFQRKQSDDPLLAFYYILLQLIIFFRYYLHTIKCINIKSTVQSVFTYAYSQVTTNQIYIRTFPALPQVSLRPVPVITSSVEKPCSHLYRHRLDIPILYLHMNGIIQNVVFVCLHSFA